MSFLSDASLVMIPSGYKDGTLYSAKPTNGDGDFTFSRGSNLAATRVNSDGLIEKGRENLFFASDTSDSTAGRAIRGSSTTIKGVSGFLYSDDAGNPNINKSIAGYSTGFATFSIYVDTTNANTIQLNFAIDGSAINGTQAKFNATTKTWNSIVENTSYVSSGSTQLNFEDLGDNVFRLSIGANFTPSGSTYLPVVYFGTGNTNVAIGGGQVEKGLVATDYIETTTTTAQAGILEDMPRLDYSGTCPSLLLEPQRTNLVPFSEHLESSDWAKTRCTIEDNSTTSPEGVINASKMTSTDASESYIQDNFATTGTKITWSFFAKKGDLDYAHGLVWDLSANGCRQWFNLSTGAVGGTTTFGSGYSVDSATIEDYNNGWYRCVMVVNSTAGSQGCRVNISSADTTIGSAVNSYGYFYGLQAEDASYATSYIPTYGASVTRSQDSCSKTGISSLIGQTEGTFFAEIDSSQFLTGSYIGISDGGTTNRQIFGWEANSGDSGSLRLYGFWNGFAYSSFSKGEKIKVALAYKTNDFALYVNGTQAGTNTSASVSGTLSQFAFNSGATAQKYQGNVYQAILFPTRLSNDELASLTTI